LRRALFIRVGKEELKMPAGGSKTKAAPRNRVTGITKLMKGLSELQSAE